jgi:uncharacterized ferritin-like protein (DUF455 family)
MAGKLDANPLSSFKVLPQKIPTSVEVLDVIYDGRIDSVRRS